MKHQTSRSLHAYWDRLRGARSAPERAEIEPGEIRHILADSLILEIDMSRRSAQLRLAGTRVCALYGRELRGLPLGSLWQPGEPPSWTGAPHAESWRVVEIVANDMVGVVMGLRGLTALGESVDLELLLLPLRHRGRTHARMLGTLSAHQLPSWIGLRPLVRLETTSLRVLAGPALAVDDAPSLDRLPPPANDTAPVRRGHLLVHLGGRA
ncbi:PAS domain-containing protein [Methylobacterium symbioticum]|jgi:hypothetical protein|uniref:PAS domain-containing protein n=1 Tax=Methylobacterium symbioticum TaxID=2584084 RepID=A0A509EJQ0_9HYPH|nr:PAS domain-containing protein [Methylobacterium symbioticum]VUD74391.1 hypothetical protein MET9862_05020 [Methylobacterium symbioticum]